MDAKENRMSMGPQDYMKFLDLLLGAGSRLPAATPLILDGMADMTNGIGKWERAAEVIAGTIPAEARKHMLKVGTPFQVPKVAIEKEKQVIKLLMAAHDHPSADKEQIDKLKAIGDGQLILLFRNLWSFLQANPQLYQFLITLLTGVLTPTPATQV